MESFDPNKYGTKINDFKPEDYGIKVDESPISYPKSGMEKTGNVLNTVFGGRKLGEALGSVRTKSQILEGNLGVPELNYSKFPLEVIRRLKEKGVPTDTQSARREVAKSVQFPTGQEVLGDAVRVGLNFIPAGKIAEGIQTGLKAVPLLGKLAKPIANIGTGAGTGALFQGATNLSEGKPIGENVDSTALLGGSIPMIPSLARGAGKVTKAILGQTTGEGSGSLGKLVESIRAGGESAKLARAGMRGNLNQEELANDAKAALGNLLSERTTQYQNQLAKLKTNTNVIDHTPIIENFNKQLEKFGVDFLPNGQPDYSRSPGLGRYAKDLEGLSKVLSTWGTKPGDTTIVGVDKLKQIIDNFKIGTPDAANFDSFVNALRKDAKGLVQQSLTKSGDIQTLNTYNKMLSDYEKQTKDIAAAQSLLGVGGKDNADKAFQRLSKVFKGNSEMKQRLLQELNDASGGTLIPKIVGTQFSHGLPNAMRTGFGAVTGATTGAITGVSVLPIISSLASFSPRVVGELANILGIGLRGKDILSKVIFGTGANKALFPGDVLVNEAKKIPFIPKRK